MHAAAKARIAEALQTNTVSILPATIPSAEIGNIAYIKTQILALCEAALLDDTLSANDRGKMATIRSRVEIEL